MSSWVSTSAISGLVGRDRRAATSDGLTTRSRQGEAAESGSGAGAWVRVEYAVGLRVAQQARRAQVGRERAGARARRAPGAAGDVLGAVGAGDPGGGPAGLRADDPAARVGLRGRDGDVAGQRDARRAVGAAQRGGGGRRSGARRDEGGDGRELGPCLHPA